MQPLVRKDLFFPHFVAHCGQEGRCQGLKVQGAQSPRSVYIHTHCCCDAKQSFQGLFSSTTIMTTPDLTSTPKFKLWSYIVVVAQMRWTTTKLQKDEEEEENRDERRRRGNVHGDFQLYYTRHMCCCMLLLFFLDDMETSICIENVWIFDCYLPSCDIAW